MGYRLNLHITGKKNGGPIDQLLDHLEKLDHVSPDIKRAWVIDALLGKLNGTAGLLGEIHVEQAVNGSKPAVPAQAIGNQSNTSKLETQPKPKVVKPDLSTVNSKPEAVQATSGPTKAGDMMSKLSHGMP